MLVVLGHPSADSLGAALAGAVAAGAAAEGAVVMRHDLYRDDFDPRLAAAEIDSPTFVDDVARGYAADLVVSDAVVVVHPVWFFSPPAAVKGWVDRIVRQGVAFDVSDDGKVSGRLAARFAAVVTTGNASSSTEEALGDPITRFWRDVVFAPCGVRRTTRLAFSPVRGGTEASRRSWLVEAEELGADLVRSCRAYGVPQRARQRRDDPA